MSKRAIGWTVFLVLAMGAAGAMLFVNKQSQDVLEDHDSTFPNGLVVNFHCVNSGSTPITFAVDESKLPAMPIAKPANTKKAAKGAPPANDVHYAKPLTVEAGKEGDFNIAPYFKSATEIVSITINAVNGGKVVDSATGSLNGESALSATGNRFTATWDGSKLAVARGGPGKKPASGAKKGGGGGG